MAGTDVEIRHSNTEENVFFFIKGSMIFYTKNSIGNFALFLYPRMSALRDSISLQKLKITQIYYHFFSKFNTFIRILN